MANTITLPDLRKIRINDPLFSHYAGKVAKKMIPVQRDILNGKGSSKCFCIDNFRVASLERTQIFLDILRKYDMITKSSGGRYVNMGEFPSGQRGQTVNLLLIASVVRIHLPPPTPHQFWCGVSFAFGENMRFSPLKS